MVTVPWSMEGEWMEECAAKGTDETAASAAALKLSARKSRRSGLAGPECFVLLIRDSGSGGHAQDRTHVSSRKVGHAHDQRPSSLATTSSVVTRSLAI